MADARGRVVAVVRTPGNVADITMAAPLLEAIAPTRRPIADKGYDVDRLRGWLKEGRMRPSSPAAPRDVVYPLNRKACRRRNVIERMFGGLRN